MIANEKIKELLAVKNNVMGRPYACDIMKIMGKNLNDYAEVTAELLRRLGDDKCPLISESPTVLICKPSQEKIARKILESDRTEWGHGIIRRLTMNRNATKLSNKPKQRH